MVEGPQPGEPPNRPPFPGDAFWKLVESTATSIGLGSPRNIFKIRKVRARWEERREAERNLGRGITYTHKACPACGRLVERAKAECSYCGANVRWAPGPGLMRWLGLSIPHGSTSMALVAVNILLYAITTLATLASPPPDPLSPAPDLLRALFAPAGPVLYHMGSLDLGAVLVGQVWRLWTYQFLHYGAIHILFNMMALLSLGPMSEDVYGTWKTMVVYWTTGVGAGLTTMGMRLTMASRVLHVNPLTIDPHLLIHELPATVGASGSIFGLIGLLIGQTIRRRGTQLARMRPVFVQWAVYGFVMGFFLHADNAAHFGGLVTGIVLGLVVSDRRSLGPWMQVWRFAALTVVALILYGFASAAIFAPPQPAPLPGELGTRLEAPPPRADHARVAAADPGARRHDRASRAPLEPAPPEDASARLARACTARPSRPPCATLPPCSAASFRGMDARLRVSARSPSPPAISC